MCVCRGIFMYTRVGWVFFRCMCWFHGHMIPTSCGSDWPGLVFVILKNRVVFRKSVALRSSYRLIWESRLLPLKMLVSCIICFKRIWEFHALKTFMRRHYMQFIWFFLWCMVHIAIKITFPFVPLMPPRPRLVWWPCHFSPFSFSFPLLSLKAELLSVWQNYDAT